VGLNFHALLVVCAAINVIAIGRFIYRYSEIPWLSFSLVCGFGIFTYMFGILRQSLALSFILFALDCVIDKKNIRAFLFFIIAVTFHRTALLAVLFIPLFNVHEIRKAHYIAAFAGWFPFLVIAGMFYNYIITAIMRFFSKGYRGHDMQWNNLMLLLVVIVIFVIVFADFNTFSKKIELLSICAILIAVYVETLGMFNDIFARCIQFFTIFECLVIPKVLVEYPSKEVSGIGKAVVYILLLGYMIYTLNGTAIVPYRMV